MRQKTTTTTTTGDDAQGHHGIQPRAQHRSKQPLGENLEYEAENCLTKDYQRIVGQNVIKELFDKLLSKVKAFVLSCAIFSLASPLGVGIGDTFCLM